MQRFEADGQQLSATAVGEEAEVANTNKSPRQQMQQEAAQKLIRWEAYQLLPVAVCGVAPTKADVVIVQCNESMVGDRDAMRVGAEIAQNVLRAFRRDAWRRRPNRGGTEFAAMLRSAAS
jgi:hypothetical protein